MEIENRPQLVGIHHVALEVGDIEGAPAFYGKIFSLLAARRPQGSIRQDDHGFDKNGRPVKCLRFRKADL
jgi:catechol 2,3-dioxygenase-like lactoylglutathione lyase family enzyme